jgi:hypothetical protein
MKTTDDLPGFEGVGESPPFADEAAELWKSINESDRSKAAQTLLLVQGLSKEGLNRTQITQIVLHVVPGSKTPRQSEAVKLKPEADNTSARMEKIDYLSEITALLPRLESGKKYRIQYFHDMLSNDSQIATLETVKGRQTAIGQCLAELVRQGILQKLRGRYATYGLTHDGNE